MSRKNSDDRLLAKSGETRTRLTDRKMRSHSIGSLNTPTIEALNQTNYASKVENTIRDCKQSPTSKIPGQSDNNKISTNDSISNNDAFLPKNCIMQSSQNYEKDAHKRLRSQESPSEKTSQKRLCDGIRANNQR